MPDVRLLVILVIIPLALVFDFINGFHDSANAIATSVSTRVLTMREAILMSVGMNFLGAFLSVNVAETIGDGIINVKMVPLKIVIFALIAAIIWNLITWYFAIPSSSSHALIGGLVGAAIINYSSLAKINWGNLFSKVILWLFLSPIIGFIMGYIFMKLLNLILSPLRPKTVTKIFSKAQIASAMAMALNHGANDAQKSMGVISMALVTAQFIPSFHVPIWVTAACALSMALGTSFGGWKIIKTMGVKMAKLAPVNGFAAETGAATVIFTATLLKAPVSTTHIISTSIMGVAASKRLSSVRWSLAKDIVWAWVLTIPVCAVIAGILVLISQVIVKII